jgi:hypothetical protein
MNGTTMNGTSLNSISLNGRTMNGTVNTTKKSRQWTTEEIIAGIKDCAAKLGHPPTRREVSVAHGIQAQDYQRMFGSYTRALKAAGLEGGGSGHVRQLNELFEEWATIVREVGQVPSLGEYRFRSKYSVGPLRKRFGGWMHVTKGLLQYAAENKLEERWGDVLDIARRYKPHLKSLRSNAMESSMSTSSARVLKDRPISGAPFAVLPMVFTPVNEMGVVYLFGTMATRLGFMLTYIGTQYPDAEAYREVAPGRWQLERVEFEMYSRNFLLHGHDPKDCDLIVCWEHNWEECPVEVLELKKALSNQQSAFSR